MGATINTATILVVSFIELWGVNGKNEEEKKKKLLSQAAKQGYILWKKTMPFNLFIDSLIIMGAKSSWCAFLFE